MNFSPISMFTSIDICGRLTAEFRRSNIFSSITATIIFREKVLSKTIFLSTIFISFSVVLSKILLINLNVQLHKAIRWPSLY